MFAEVFNPTRPPAPHRAPIAGVLLLLFASALAAEMSWRRTGDPLAARIHPPGWSISFQAPRGWIRSVRAVGATEVVAFHGANRAGHPTTLAFWRLDQWTGDDLETVCVLILGQHGAQVLPDRAPTDLTSPATQFGPVDGFELVDREQTTVVRAAQLSAGEAYAVSLGIDHDVIDEHAYGLFDLACRSIEYEGR